MSYAQRIYDRAHTDLGWRNMLYLFEYPSSLATEYAIGRAGSP